MPARSSKPLSYAGYLKLHELLALQEPLSEGPEHDEMLFIVIHQVYELWFRELLHEMDYLVARLDRDELALALHTLKRVLTVLKVLVAQVDVLETMTPLEFLSFRDWLESASGLQSHQFRALEFVLGHKQGAVLEKFAPGTPEREALESRWAGQTLWDAFLAYLVRAGFPVPDAVLSRDPTAEVVPDPGVQAALLRVYREDPANSELCERMVDVDEGLQEWRYRHYKMVQRTIGTKIGTGGSSGAEYLARTLSRPTFPDLWAIRTAM